MLRNFVLWFIIFGLSFFVQSLGWADQGTAFLWLDLGGTGILLALIIIGCLVTGYSWSKKLGSSLIVAVIGTIFLGITLFTTWGATQLLGVEFIVVYQIMTFGQCIDISFDKGEGMLRKFASWFIIFGLSFLVQSWGWADQGTAFLWIDLGGTGIFFAVIFILALVTGYDWCDKFESSFKIAIMSVMILGVILFATWGATQLFDVEFAVAYQIMTFGQCMNVDIKKED